MFRFIYDFYIHDVSLILKLFLYYSEYLILFWELFKLKNSESILLFSESLFIRVLRPAYKDRKLC